MVILVVGCGSGRSEPTDQQLINPPGEVEDAGAPLDAGLEDAGVPLDAGVEDAGLHQLDAGTSALVDAGATGTPDAGRWVGDVELLLRSHCSGCHTLSRVDNEPRFLDSYQVLLQPSVQCAGARVGDCVARALSIQAVEGTSCRTYLMPFHREPWRCLATDEVDRVLRWVDAGMPER